MLWICQWPQCLVLTLKKSTETPMHKTHCCSRMTKENQSCKFVAFREDRADAHTSLALEASRVKAEHQWASFLDKWHVPCVTLPVFSVVEEHPLNFRLPVLKETQQVKSYFEEGVTSQFWENSSSFLRESGSANCAARNLANTQRLKTLNSGIRASYKNLQHSFFKGNHLTFYAWTSGLLAVFSFIYKSIFAPKGIFSHASLDSHCIRKKHWWTSRSEDTAVKIGIFVTFTQVWMLSEDLTVQGKISCISKQEAAWSGFCSHVLQTCSVLTNFFVCLPRTLKNIIKLFQHYWSHKTCRKYGFVYFLPVSTLLVQKTRKFGEN